MRHSFQTAMEVPFRKVVEAALDRKVIAYMSQIHHDPDIAMELFVLGSGTDAEPEYHEAPVPGSD